MAVTAHYAVFSESSGNLETQTSLVAFRELKGSHSGANIGKVFLQIIKEIGCLNKVCFLLIFNIP